MKRMLALVLALVMVISLMPAITVSAQTSDRVADLVANMSLRDKVTQMMMVDFRKWGETAETATDFTVMNDEVRQIVEDYNFGSVIYFANNIKTTEETFALTQEMQAAATKDGGIALIICADQEGGSVYRLGSGTALPGNMALGATYAANGTKYAYEAGKIIGSELSVLGINGNLAPVVDVNNNANNPVIGLRSYSDDATIVGELASASIAGMAEYNVIGTAKHFPGHGDTATDSHTGLPIVDKSLDVLKETELKPYEVAIDQGIEMIMTAHILYPQLESDTIVSNKTGEAESLPATMSDDILTGLLKGDMGFEGIIVTDAMNMAGIANKWDEVQSVIIAINAGVDMFCMPTQLYCMADLADLDAIIEGVIAAVESGEISMDRIDDAVTRILTVKENRGILDYNAEDYSLEEAQTVVGSDTNRAMERELAAAAVTVIKNENDVLPLQLTETSKVLMLVPYNNESAQMLMAWNRAKDAGLVPEGAEVDYYRFNSTTINDTLLTKLEWADTYIINSEISSTARMEYKHWLSALPNAVCDYAAENGKTAIISSVDKPYDVQMYPNADAIVAAYGCKGSSVDVTEALIGGATGSEAAYGPNIIAAVEVILGTFEAKGQLPVNIPKYDVESNSYLDEIVYERGYGLTYEAEATEIGRILGTMSLRDKVTQMMMPDFRQWTVDGAVTDFTVMNDEVRQIIEDYNFGSIILFANNIKETEQSYNLTMAMQEAATKDGGIALLISADQEGGSVYRLGSGTALPGNMALGATYAANGTKYALEAGRIIGSELSVLGINTNLAPVVDVNNNANNPVIGLRSYSDDATMVGELASASIAGMAEYNVIGTAKHFPGHGDTATDSHYGLPIVDKSLDVLKEVELKPYEVAIDQGIEMIMTAHILYPQLESDKIVSNKTGEAESLPATMSDDILTDLLKGEMGFEGIIVTDAMNMAGISGKWDQVQSCVIAIQAGVDMLCMPTELRSIDDMAKLDAIIDGIIAAVEDGTIPMERINDAVKRILTVKENRGILDYNAEDYSLEKANEVVGSDANREMEREIAANAVTVVKNENNTLPLNLTAESKVLMLCPYNNERAQMLMAWNRAVDACLIPEGAEVDYYRFNSATITEELQAKLDWADTYIIITEVSSVARMEYKHWLSAGPNAFCDYAAANGKTAIIASCDKPYDVQMYPNADAILAAYGCKGSSVDPTEAIIGGATGSAAAYGPNIIAAVEVALGTFGATGALPVNVPKYDVESNTYLDEIVYERGYGLTYEAKERHFEEIIPGYEATFDATGLTEGKVCSVCGEILVAQETIPMLDYNEGIVPLNTLVVSCGDYQTGYEATEGPAELAVDDNLNTIWHTNWYGTSRDNHWLQFELTEAYAVDGLRYKPRVTGNTNGIITQYDIQVSNDGVNFESVAAGYWEGDRNWKVVEFDAQNVKYVRLVALDALTDNDYVFACAAEVRLTGVKTDAPPHEHAFGEWAVTTEPTCTASGVETRTCECGETETREIPALGHTEEVIPAVAATCTETGLTEGKKCSVCNEILVAQEVVPALGHDYVNGICSRCAAEQEATFEDVPVGSFYFDAVEWAVEQGITTGATETTFNPEGELQRAAVVVMLWRAAGKPEPTTTVNPFVDVKETDFYYKAVLWAVEKEITNGSDATHFNPYGVTNRAQAVTFLWRYLGKPASTGSNSFTDVEAGMWYEAPINWAVENKVTNGMSETQFGIEVNCNRAQMVTFLYRALAD